MTHVWIDLEIFDLQKTKSKKLKGLVDTGATLTVLPQKLAEELGIKKLAEDKVETGAGILKVSRGRAIIKIKDKEDVQTIWISDIIDKVLVGSVTLEVMGLKVNPVTGKIEDTPLLLYYGETSNA